MSWLAENAAALSDFFGLLASIFLFIPLIGLVSLAKQFRQLRDLGDREGMTQADIDVFRQQIINERHADGQEKWLYMAGASFVLALLFMFWPGA